MYGKFSKPGYLILLFCGLLVHGQDAEYELIPQMIHEYALEDLAYAPGGRYFASASHDRVLLWEVNTGKQIRIFSGMGKGFTCIDFSPDGRYLAAGAIDKSVVVWRLDSGELVKVLVGHDYEVCDIAFSPDSLFIASVASRWAAKEGEITQSPESRSQVVTGELSSYLSGLRKVMSSELKIWNWASGTVVSDFDGQYLPIEPICFAPDGQSIVAGGIPFTAGRWDVVTGRLMQVYTRGNHLLQSIAFSPDGRILAAAYWGKDYRHFPARGLQLWRADNGQVLHDFSGYSGFVQDLAFSSDGSALVTATNDFEVFLPEYRGRSNVVPLSDRTLDPVPASQGEKFTLDPDGIRAKQRDGSFRINRHGSKSYKVGELKLWRVADGKDLGSFVRDSSPIYCVAFGDDGHVISDGPGYSIKRWSARTLAETHSLQGLTSPVQDLVFSPDGRWLANLGAANSFRIWDIANMRRVRVFRGHQDRINAVTFSPDGALVASSSEDKSIRIWDVEQGDLLQTLSCLKYPRGLAFSPDGRFLVDIEWPHLGLRSLRDKRVAWWERIDNLWVPSSQRSAWNIGKVKYNQIDYSSDGRFLLLSSGFRHLGRYEYASAAPTDLWDIQKAQAVHRFETSDAADLCSDGRFVAAARGKDIDVWEVRNHERRFRLEALAASSELRLDVKQELGVTSVAFSPDGKLMVSCGLDKMLRIWDLETGKILRTLVGQFQLARFSPAGNLLASANFDGRIELRAVADLVGERGHVPPLLTLIGASESAGFIAFTHDLFYKSTRDGYKAVVVLKDNQAYGFDQFDALLNRPDLVLAALPGADPLLISAYKRAYEQRLQKLGLDEAKLALDFRLPKLVIEGSDPVGKTQQHRVRLVLGLQDEHHPLDRLMVWCNGVPVHGRRGLVLDGGEHHFRGLLKVDLAFGPNLIEVSAMNDRGVASYRKTLFFERTEPAKPELYLVAIGVSDYSRDGDMRDLVYADKDARDLMAALQGHRDLFGQIHMMPLLDGSVTRENIQRSRDFLAAAGVDDQVVFFMAGHGLLGANHEFYFGTSDIDFNQPETRGFAYTELETLMFGLKARRKLVLIDACYSGAIDDASFSSAQLANSRGFSKKTSGSKARPASMTVGHIADLMNDLFIDLDRGSGTMVISSARGFAYESEKWGNGAFTHALLDGLSLDPRSGLPTADLDKNRSLDISELRRFTMTEVQRLTGGQQKPVSREETSIFDYPLLELPAKRPGFIKRVKSRAQALIVDLQNQLTQTVWKDTVKPEPFRGKYSRMQRLPHLEPGEERVPDADYYPAEPAADEARICDEGPIHFAGCEGVKRRDGVLAFAFTRNDGSKGQVYAFLQPQPVATEVMIEEVLAFDYTTIARIHKDFLQEGRNSIVKQEAWTLQGHPVIFLATSATYDSGMGSLTRMYYHLLYTAEDHSLRLTTAGGHHDDRGDIDSFRYDTSFVEAVRALFERFRLASL